MPPLPGSLALGHGGPDASLTSPVVPAAPWLPGIAPTISYLTVSDAAPFSPNDYIRIDGELMVVINADTGNNVLTVIRGANGTGPTAHSTNAGAYLATDQRGAFRANSPNIGAV
jgi:hypothetical protein